MIGTMVRRMTIGACAALAITVTASVTRADDDKRHEESADDAVWRAAPVALVESSYLFKLPEKGAGEAVWHKLPFAFKNGNVIELCALKGTLEARARLGHDWANLGPIGPGTPVGPCILLSGAKVMVTNTADQAATGRATPK